MRIFHVSPPKNRIETYGVSTYLLVIETALNELSFHKEEQPMCGRFTQFQNRDTYFDALSVADGDYIHDPEPIGTPGFLILLSVSLFVL